MNTVQEMIHRFSIRRKKSRLFSMTFGQRVVFVSLIVAGFFMLLPLIFIFNHAFKPYSELFLYPPRIFVREATIGSFLELFVVTRDSVVPTSRYVFNSILIAVLSTSAVIVASALAAYPLAKHKFPGKDALFYTIILSLMFVPETMQIPRYVVVSTLGLMDSYAAHVLPHVAAPVGVFLMRQFMLQVPDELIEAAKLDGAKEFFIFLKVVVPICIPAMATVAILQFQNIWANTETSVLFMSDDSMKTFPFFLQTLTQNLANSVARQGAAAAASMIMFLPTLIMFLVFQRKVIATMAHSGIK
jgi:ABC-type glycerol-3-phosphate transport system permease component